MISYSDAVVAQYNKIVRQSLFLFQKRNFQASAVRDWWDNGFVYVINKGVRSIRMCIRVTSAAAAVTGSCGELVSSCGCISLCHT